MNIKRIVIQNFGPHKSTDICFNDSLVGIIGSNGVGKSFLIESVPSCFFGVFPSRGNILDGITNNFTGDSYISIYFTHNNIDYIAERKIRKTAKGNTHEAILTSDGKCIAGPKVTDFENTLKSMFPKDIFFSSTFSAQNGSGDFINCSATERKSIMVESMGLHRFQEKSDQYKEIAKGLKKSLEEYQAKRESLESMIMPEIPIQDTKQLITEKEYMESKRDDLRAKITAMEESRKKVLYLERKKEVLDDKKRDLSNKRIQLISLSSELQNIKKKLDINAYIIKKNEIANTDNLKRSEIITSNLTTKSTWQQECQKVTI